VTTLLVLMVVSYALGSLPFGLWLMRAEGIDLRASGSGNIGATNVWRAAGRWMALLVLALDAGKGALAAFLARVVIDEPYATAACAVAVVAGHVWPIWAGFRGGKGVATVAGAFALITPLAVVWCVVVFGCVLAMTRYVSVGSLAAAGMLPIATLLVDEPPPVTVGACVVAALVVWRHRTNIGRLWTGREPRVGARGVDRRRRTPFVV
jgi:acyl phosphate:glycerol-3-phosphate acyltransferase